MVMFRNSLGRYLLKGLCLVGLAAGSAVPAHAASFECEQAKTKVEKLICAGKTVSSLDDKLAEAFEAASELAADPDGLRVTQRDWIKQRNLCGDAACLSSRYHERLAALVVIPKAGWKSYRDPTLGIAFDYLANRQVKPCADAGTSKGCVMLIRRNMRTSDYLIQFQIQDGALEKNAGDAGFDKQDGKWFTIFGPGTPQEAQPFSGKGWKGLQATISCGVDDALGFHAGAGECFWAVLSNGKRSAIADTQGLIGSDDATMRSVNSFQFLN